MPDSKIHILSTALIEQSPAQTGPEDHMAWDMISFTEIIPVKDEILGKEIDGYAGQPITAVFTSGNAVAAVTRLLGWQRPSWKIYCTDGHTRERVLSFFGETSIAGTAQDAASLADRLLQDSITEPVFFCGNRRRDELPQELTDKGIRIKELEVYQTILTPQRVNESYDGILFFSPSGVESFFSLNTVKENTVLFAIGKTTANSIRSFSGNKIIMGDRPGKDSLLQQCVRYFQSADTHQT